MALEHDSLKREWLEIDRAPESLDPRVEFFNKVPDDRIEYPDFHKPFDWSAESSLAQATLPKVKA